VSTTVAGDAAAARSVSTWAPLSHRTFRLIFLAQLGSNVGTWMQTVGAQWLLVGEPRASTLVALVQTATSLPFMLFGLPAGVLADVFDRRSFLAGVQALMCVTAALMAAVTYAGDMNPTLLLTLTFVLGTGTALSLPAWQAITPSLVRRRELPSASALNGMSQNIARAIGPAVAGVLVAQIGAASVFLINAASFVAGIVVLLTWHPAQDADDPLGRERLGPALRAGTRGEFQT
jgi:MFS family permease